MGTVTFERPVGAHADVKELEFVSALMQTDKMGPYFKGNIRGIDIVHFLRSRHGVVVSEERINESVLRDMAGQTAVDDDDAQLDICELTAILLIPQIIEASRKRQLGNRVFGPVFDSIRSMTEQEGNGSQNKGVLNRTTLRTIFYQLDEFNVSDDLLDEMIAVAGGEKASLVRALTGDLQAYNLDWHHTATTHYQDATEKKRTVSSDASSLSLQQAPTAGASSQEEDMASNTDIEDNSKEIQKEQFKDEGSNSHHSQHRAVADIEKPQKNVDDQQLTKLERRFMAPSVDYVAGSYRRPMFVMCLWVCGVASYFSYVFKQGEGNWAHTGCDRISVVGCMIVVGIIRWLAILVQLSTLGLAFIFLGSQGSSVFIESKWFAVSSQLVGILAVCLLGIVPFFVDVDTKFFNTQGNKDNSFGGASYFIAIILGFVLLSMQIVDLIFMLIPKGWLVGKEFVARLITPGTYTNEAKLKRAASYKIARMVESALFLHKEGSHPNASVRASVQSRSAGTSSHVRAALNYQIADLQFEKVGGVVWAWRKMFDGSIFVEEGIWLHSRLLACNLVQVVIAAFVLYFATMAYKFPNMADAAADELVDEVVTEAVDALANITDDDAFANSTSYPTAYVSPSPTELWPTMAPTTMSAAQGDTLFWTAANILGINKGKYYFAITLGLCGGLAASAYVSMVYIPSYISTVLKFRCGIIPSLQDRDFLEYRSSYDAVTILFGSTFWGCFVSSIFAGGLFGLVGFALVIDWKSLFGGNLAVHLAGTVIGFAVVMAIKMIVLLFLRSTACAAFYRKRPGMFNIWMIAMEVWHIALSVGFILIRTVKILVIAIFFVARIDTPFMAPGVGRVGKAEVGDGYPQAFRKDLLTQEAHHHCYIERFGLLCLLKLRYGDGFARRPNACWRLLFTMILMPWLRRYREKRELTPEELDAVVKELETRMKMESDETTLEGLKEKRARIKGGKESSSGEDGAPSTSNKEDALYRENVALRDRVRNLEEEVRKLKLSES